MLLSVPSNPPRPTKTVTPHARLGLSLYYGTLDQSLKIEEIEDGRLPSVLIDEGIILPVARDTDDCQWQPQAVYGCSSKWWQRKPIVPIAIVAIN